MTDNATVADTLERAADLYESEQVGWCQFKWVGAEVGPTPDGAAWWRTGRMTMCAEGALLKAVGFDYQWIDNFGDGLLTGVGIDDKYDIIYQTYMAAVAAVEAQLPPVPADIHAEDEEGPFTGQEADWSLAGWNDRVVKDKAEVVEIFKATAKDLRNG